MKKLNEKQIEKLADNAIYKNIEKHEVAEDNGFWSYYTLKFAEPPTHNSHCIPDRYIMKSEKAMLIAFAKKLIEELNK